MRFVSVLFCLSVFIGFFTGCETRDLFRPDPMLEVNPKELTVEWSAESSAVFSIASNVSWTISSDADWLIAEPDSGRENAYITLKTVSANSVEGERTATVSISTNDLDDRTVTVTQFVSPETGTMTGNDGKEYVTLKIGGQWWMMENLRETRYRSGDTIAVVTDNAQWGRLSTGARCVYNNIESNAETYGYLYNWHAVNDIRNIAPEGWRVPTDEDWQELEMVLGMSQDEADNTDERGIEENVGGMMKKSGTQYWKSPNTNASNESGFAALPGGYRDGERYLSLGYYAFFWSSSECEDNADNAWRRFLRYYNSGINRHVSNKTFGYSVRLVMEQ